ncbi:MAG: hypothetical protein ACOY82_18580 [Pseudomonadota bacterium]
MTPTLRPGFAVAFPLVVAFAFVFAAGRSAAADAGLAAQASASATPEAVAADPAGVWERFLAHATLKEAYERFAMMDAVGYSFSAVDANACRERAAELRAAVDAVPVSIAMHRVAMMCAEATGDRDVADREAAALAALARHALSADAGGLVSRPIQVLSPRDVYALLALLGYELRYEYYRGVRPRRYLPMAVAAWDADAGVERHLVFDFVDVTHTIDRTDPYSDYPFQRHLLASVFGEGQKNGGESVGIDFVAMRDALAESDLDARLRHLREGAAAGGILSLANWMVFCSQRRTPECADGLIDALLPLAEREHAVPMALLALAHAEGIGVARDQKAAEALLDAADRRWHRRGASVYYAGIENQVRSDGYSDFAVRRLQRSIDAGNADAGMLMLLVRAARSDKTKLRAKDLEMLARPSNNLHGFGFAVIAAHHREHGREAEAQAAMRKAAEAGHAESQRIIAFQRKEGGAPEPEWLPWMTAAAHGGDFDAARFLSLRAGDAGEWKRAAGWLMADVAEDNIEAVYALADLYEGEHPELEGGLDKAIGMYEALAAIPGDDGNEARRRLAGFASDGRGMKRSFARAKRLLEADAERGDVDSQALLGALQLEQDDAAERTAGERWLQRAIDAGDNWARISYARWLQVRDDSAPAHRARARTLLREADPEADGYDVARNNLAWMLCVSRHDDTRDPAAGLILAREMERAQGEALSPGDTDTVAACLAANGDHAGAARLQQKAIDALPKGADGAPQGNAGMFDRLALYRAGKAFIEID